MVDIDEIYDAAFDRERFEPLLRKILTAMGAQAGFLRPEDAKGVDLIFRHDRIGDLVNYLEDRLATTITLPVVNVSPKAETTLSATTEALLHRFSARDFELYAGLQ